MATMLLTTALRKRQTLKARIDTSLKNLILVGAVSGDAQKPDRPAFKTQEEYTAAIRASNDSYLALQKEYFDLVTLINKANNENTIVIGGITVPLSTAIEMRNNTQWQRNYTSTLQSQLGHINERIRASNERLEGEIQTVVARSQNDSMTPTDIKELEEQTRTRMEKAHKASLHDPLNADKLLETAAAAYIELADEVDTKLNIANATILIGTPDPVKEV